MLYKIKKILKAKINTENDYEKIIYKLVHRIELFSIFMIFGLLLKKVAIDFDFDFYTASLLSGFLVLLLSKSISFKYFTIKRIIYYLFLFCGGMFFINHKFIYLLWFYILIIYFSYFEKRTYSFILLASLLVIINFMDNGISLNSTQLDFESESLFIVIYAAINAFTIFLVRDFSKSFKFKFDEIEITTKRIIADREKLKSLNSQLIKEAEVRENIQQNLENSRLRFKTIFDEANDAIMIHDINNVILEANKEAIERYGLDGKNLSKIRYDDLLSEDIKPFLNERRKIVSDEKYAVFESEHIDKDGKIIYVENKITFIEHDNFKFYVNVSRDITSRKLQEIEQRDAENKLRKMVLERTAQLEDAMTELRAEIEDKNKTEQELIKTKEELEKSLEIEREYSALKTRFVSMISHEYRTPLTVILSSTYILDHFFNIQDKENFQKNITKIQGSVQSMTNLLEDVIKIGKSESQLSQVSLNKFNIIKLIDEILNEIKFIEKTPHNYEFICEYKELHINSDEKLQSHIIRNLIQNASKYSEKGTTIKVKLYMVDDNMNLIVSDEGIGIPENDLKHLFEPFFRSGNVGAREGTGLGLPLTKRYTEALNGTIEVESIENQGTSMKLVFPIKQYEIK